MLLHFAYGSNMDRALMRRHCPSGHPVGTAVLQHYRFIISSDGYASIVPRPAALVHGVLWELSETDIAALDAYESLATGLYRREDVTVRVQGRPVAAMAYIGRTGAEGVAQPGYLDLVMAAARDWNLPSEYVEALATWPQDSHASNQEGIA